MIKQAVLFVASTGVLIYFIAPVDDDTQNQPTAQQVPQAKPNKQTNQPDLWGTDDSEDDEDFVFGEPLVYSETDDDSAENNGEVEGEVVAAPSERIVRVAKPNYVSPAVYSQAPKPGGLGSKENPIDMTPPGGRK